MLIFKQLILKMTLLCVVLLAMTNATVAYAYDGAHSYKYSSKQAYSKNKQSAYTPKRYYAQKKYRSRSSVMEEVKRRYNAKVLKISLNEKAGVYNVRVLMPSGKVRSLQVNAGG